MCKDNNENNEQTGNNCRNCGSIDEEDGDTHIHCADCGIPKDALDDDSGFVPTNPNHTSITSDRLGSHMGPSRDRKIRRLRTLNGRVIHTKPSFLDGIIEMLSQTPVGPNLHAAAVEIIKKADSKKALGSMRHSLRSSPDSSDEAKEYRQHLFVLAALELLDDAGYETPIATMKQEWNIDRYDLKKVKSRLGKSVKGQVECLSNSNTDSATARRSAMLHQLSTYRDHLAEQESIAIAREVFETAKEIASSMGEPIDDNDDWVFSETTNRPVSTVAGKAFFEAMHRHDFSREGILELHGRCPVYTLDTFILKKGWEGRTDDVTEEA